ncbi:bifunctional DNA primase/polymerase [Streptomyces beihaiensis]|uniref:Bifunctional DNA primase/polymerase n=1 Tax=Streptomyces beihaiensis TaxID=2984495 RepID=A0ABT3U315_9ACTN|nr:bifunctional DNA primase/polymerase [Streptomyces beihaiensis]MCX3063693.1 bifunctional DNA primase/polymerase [Streptomyces beihaiensis]
MSTAHPHPAPVPAAPATAHDRFDVAGVTPDGAAWLASAGTYPRSTLAHWESRPSAPVVLACGSVFDVVNVPAVFGRLMLEQLWDEGPGSGPVAAHRGRMLLFSAPGTAHRLPSLMAWEEWGREVPPLLFHGSGDAVTVPAPTCRTALTAPTPQHLDSRWVVAPDTRRPWLPGPETLLWACVRAARAHAQATVRVSIFPHADHDAKVYDVSRRR